MDPSLGFRTWSTCSLPRHHHHHHHTSLCHHHHHHHTSLCHHHHHQHQHHHQRYQFCPQHGHCHHHHCKCNCHSHVCPRFAPPPLQNPEFVGSYALQKDLNLNLKPNVYEETSAPGTQVLHEPEQGGLEEEDEEEEDPVFVLTDEWREFFARSEAKRRLEKQQAKRKEKH